MNPKFQTRASESGRLGEDFVKKKFGVIENGEYEIKSVAQRNNQVVLKVVQLIASGSKHYIIVRYNRKRKYISRGPRKGRCVPTEKISSAYRRKLDIFILRGFDLLALISEEKRVLMITQLEKDAEWAFYWTLRITAISAILEPLYEDNDVIVYGKPSDHPGFLNAKENQLCETSPCSP